MCNIQSIGIALLQELGDMISGTVGPGPRMNIVAHYAGHDVQGRLDSWTIELFTAIIIVMRNIQSNTVCFHRDTDRDRD